VSTTRLASRTDLEVARDRHAQRGGHRRGRVPRAEGVVLALRAVREACARRASSALQLCAGVTTSIHIPSKHVIVHGALPSTTATCDPRKGASCDGRHASITAPRLPSALLPACSGRRRAPMHEPCRCETRPGQPRPARAGHAARARSAPDKPGPALHLLMRDEGWGKAGPAPDRPPVCRMVCMRSRRPVRILWPYAWCPTSHTNCARAARQASAPARARQGLAGGAAGACAGGAGRAAPRTLTLCPSLVVILHCKPKRRKNFLGKEVWTCVPWARCPDLCAGLPLSYPVKSHPIVVCPSASPREPRGCRLARGPLLWQIHRPAARSAPCRPAH